ncbi:hypothetical protein MRX96_032972 [Rhipicephalus microplus]
MLEKQTCTAVMAIFVRPSRQALPTGMDGSTSGPISQSEQEISRWLAAVAIAFSVFVIVLAVALVLQFYYPDIVPDFSRKRRLSGSARDIASRTTNTGPKPRAFLRSCGTTGCDRYPHLFASQLNQSVDPCQDLRAFSCVARPRWRHSLRDEVVENASRAVMVNVALSSSSGSAVAKTSKFYRTCVASKTPLDLQSLRAFLATMASDTKPTMPESSKAFQVMSKMAARYGNGILFCLGTGFVPQNGSRIARPALVLGLQSDFKRWMQKAMQNSEANAHQRTVNLVLSLSMSRDDFGWRNALDDVMTALRTVKDYSSRVASYTFLDAVLERVNERHIIQYLVWESARQLSTFFLHTDAAHIHHVCYSKTVELFGPAAVLAPVIWHQVSAEAVVSAETTFASVLRATEDAIYEAGARSVEEAKRMKALGNRLSQVRLAVSYPEDVRDLPALNDKLAHVPAMSDVFFANMLAAQESSWSRKKEKPSLPVPLRPSPHYDEVRNEITLPIDFLIPPLVLARLTSAPALGHHRQTPRAAAAAPPNARWNLRTMTLELLLLTCCLSMCGPHNGNICTAVMQTLLFETVFRLHREKGDVYRKNCSVH